MIGKSVSINGRDRRAALRAAATGQHRQLRGFKNGSAPVEAPSPEIFVSYSRQDSAIALSLIDWLRSAGARVTWDQDFHGGADFRREIGDAIDASECVLVIWSSSAVNSNWVQQEAQRALDQHKLVATHVAEFDFRELPFGFGGRHCVALGNEEAIRSSLARYDIQLKR